MYSKIQTNENYFKKFITSDALHIFYEVSFQVLTAVITKVIVIFDGYAVHVGIN